MPAHSARFRRMIQENVSREVRAEIGRRDLSKEGLAKALGWEPSKLRRRLSGQVPWSVDDVELIASVLDVPRAQLLDPPLQTRRAAS
jgi:ribosome-binding protein aMBF1 (putative translation factor)